LTCQEYKTSDTKKSFLTFVGGFDSKEIINNYQVDTSFLIMTCPADNYEELKDTIGSLDLPA
jgi:hypothetical protein